MTFGSWFIKESLTISKLTNIDDMNRNDGGLTLGVQAGRAFRWVDRARTTACLLTKLSPRQFGETALTAVTKAGS